MWGQGMSETASSDAGGVWRPYDEAPLITREMLEGMDACDDTTRKRLLAYLGAVIARRAAPLHTAVAFNAVYFGYDVRVGAYVGGPLDFEEFSSVALGDRGTALPVGAMVNIRTGGDLLPAEVVYKEGRHPLIGEFGETPSWLSGAPAGAKGPGYLAAERSSVLHERLVIDATAFGHEVAPTSARLQRLRRQNRIDTLGHLVVESVYASAEANLSDADYYAHHLVTRARAQLVSALTPLPLPVLLDPGYGDEHLLAAVKGLMKTLREALASLTAVRLWGDYAFPRGPFARRLASPGVLGRDDLVGLAESTIKQAVPRPGRRMPSTGPVYTAVGALIRSNATWQRHIQGTAYPTAVCHANAVVSDYALREPDEATGLLPSGIRLVLDDRWLGGGVWRASADEHADDGSVLQPLGRGWAQSLARQQRASPPTDPSASSPPQVPMPSLWPDDSELDAAVDLETEGPILTWALPLRRAHVLAACTPLPRHIADRLDSSERLTGPRSLCLKIEHAGSAPSVGTRASTVRVVSDGDGPRLDGVTWPSVLSPGLWLWFTWARGSGTIRAGTRLLDRPVTVDGELIEHRYDPKVLTRDGGRDRYTGLRDRHDAYRIVLTSIRRLGLLDRDGRALLGRSDVPTAVRAVLADLRVDTHISDDRIRDALSMLLAHRRLTVVWGSQGHDGRTRHPPLTTDQRVELVCYQPNLAYSSAPAEQHRPIPADATSIAKHHVAGFLRRIGHLGREASDEQRAFYREDRLRYRLTGPADLPAGYTYVRPHARGR